jgi:FkbM family methyltransferase
MDASSLNDHDQAIIKEVADYGTLENLTDEYKTIYGNRARFFNFTPPTHRADENWRSALGDSLSDAVPLWSQGYEELIIRDSLQDKKNGFFLDVGCFRPKFDSTTYYLEKMLGWTGIGIDAMPNYADSWAAHRPVSKYVQYAVSDTDGDTVTFHVGNVASALDENIVKNFGGKRKEIEVTTMTLNTILENNGIEKVDFLSMDIEGAEPGALKGFDIQRFKPELCCIEMISSKEVIEYFESNGYEAIEKYKKADKINWYFRPKSTE